MTSANINKLTLTIIIGFFISLGGIAQSSSDKVGYTVKIDPSIEVNARHKYIQEFNDKDQDYLIWLHTTNRVNAKLQPEQAKKSKIVRNSGGNNSLVFTITEGSEIRYDTIRNSVHPGDYTTSGGFLGLRKTFAKWKAKKAIRKINIQGDLPKGAMTSISAKRWGVKFDVLVPEPKMDVKVEVMNKDGNLVATLVDAELRKGWNNYEWKRNGEKRGKYKIRITMNNETMTQNFKM